MKLSLKNVSAGYDKSKMIIDNLSIEIEAGGIYGILGPNGAGKSTLLRVLSGTLPYSGTIHVTGGQAPCHTDVTGGQAPCHIDVRELRDISRLELSRLISVTQQFSSIYFSYSIYDTVLMGRFAHRGNSLRDIFYDSTPQDKEIVTDILKKMNLWDIRYTEISELSGGQLQRVLLARTFAQSTPVILLDEPTNHLDFKYQSELIDILREWSKASTTINDISYPNTVIAVFHDISYAAYLSDQLILMKDGNIIEKGPVQKLMNRDLLSKVYDTDIYSFYSKLSSIGII